VCRAQQKTFRQKLSTSFVDNYVDNRLAVISGSQMAQMHDVAKYILEQQGSMSAMKLQKLMYYSQAWHLVWAEQELFPEDFQAWANGPVLPGLYFRHKGQFIVDQALLPQASGAALSPMECESVNKVLGFYGQQTAQWLSNLTHQEAPWLRARDGLDPGAICNEVIPKAEMHEYYSAL